MHHKLVILSVFLLPFLTSFAQETVKETYEQIHFLQLKQENDLYQYWYKSDKNFSDGIHVEIASSMFDNKAADWFLLGFRESAFKDFELSIGQDLFTPTKTQETEVDSSDRPYTGLLYFTYSKFSNNFLKGRKLNSNFYFGIQGKEAMGKEMQNGVHRILDNPTSKGWDNQLGTGLMLDYDIMYQHLLPMGNKFYETNLYGKIHAGSIYNYASAGFNLKIGHYGDSYMNTIGLYNGRNSTHVSEEDIIDMGKSKRRLMPKHIRNGSAKQQVEYINNRMNRKFQLFLFFTLESHYTIYDGTAEGSLLPFGPNPYEYATANEERLILVGEYAIHMQIGHFQIAFNRFLENDAVNTDNLFGFGELVFTYVFY